MEILRRFVLSLGVVLTTSVNAWGYDFIVDGIAYNILSDNKVEVAQYDYNNEEYSNIVIPSKVTDNGVEYTVTSIGGYAFYLCRNYLQSIVLPNSIKSIGGGAFCNCEKLSSLYLPDGIIRIGSAAFSHCFNLSTINIPDGVIDIGELAFYHCSSLRSIVIPSSVTKIERLTFGDCTALESIVLPEGLVSVGISTFMGCMSLKSLTLPSTLSSVDYSENEPILAGCFNLEELIIKSPQIADDFYYIFRTGKAGHYYSDGLYYTYHVDGSSNSNNYFNPKRIEFPEGTTRICEYAFSWLESLESFVIPSTVKKICFSSFEGCKAISAIEIPNGVAEIESSAFSGCSSLRSIVIPESITYIGSSAFSGCTSLTYVVFPASISKLGNGIFSGCEPEIKITGDVIMPYDMAKKLGEGQFIFCFDAGLYDSYAKSTGWKDIIKYILSDDMLDLITVDITTNPNKSALYSELGNNSIYVANLKINGSINGYDLMAICNKFIHLRYLDLSDADIVANDGGYEYSSGYSLSQDNQLGKYSFNGSLIKEITLPKSLTSTGELAFCGMSYLTKVVFNEGLETIDKNAFNSCGNLTDVILPNTLKRIDSWAFSWCNSLNNIPFPSSLEYIDNYAFSECHKLNGISLPNSLEYIGSHAFSNCSSLRNIALPSSLQYIGDNAFTSLDCFGPVLRIPDNTEYIGEAAFNYCSNIDTIIIGKKVSTISKSAFSGCSVKYLEMGQGLETIGFKAFYGCLRLERIKFISNGSLSIIGDDAFSGCYRLKSINLPFSVKEIRSGAFSGCKSLKAIQIPSMTQTIGGGAFSGCDSIENVYTYTVEPTAIDQNTFSCFTTAMLNVPKTSADLYIYDTKWSQFLFVQEFDEPYDAFYLNGDVELTDETGRMKGEPDADMFAKSGFMVRGDETQELSHIELSHDGKDGATIIGAAGDVNGSKANLTAKSMNVNISVEGKRWYFFCFPFNVAHDSIECTSEYVFYSYDGLKRAQSGQGWSKMESGFNSLQKDMGYIFQASKTGVLTIHVSYEYLSFNAEDETEVLQTYTSDNLTNAHWNFVGNPFISYYDVQDLAQEYDAPIIVWNGKGYDAYRPGDDDDYQLKPFEAFFVQKSSGKQSINFLPENRITYNQALERKAQLAKQREVMGTPISPDRQLVNITIMDRDSVTDRTRIVYSTKAAMEYEIGVDAAKFHSEGVPQIYTLAGGLRYAINERPMGGDDIKLGYIAPKAGVYTLSVPRQDAEIEIYDNVAQAVVDFTFGDYTFESKAGTFNDRFVVRKTGGVTAIDGGFRLDGLTVTTIDGGIDIEGKMSGKVSVYNEAGMLLAEPAQTGRLELGDGVYIVKIGEKSVKICANY